MIFSEDDCKGSDPPTSTAEDSKYSETEVRPAMVIFASQSTFCTVTPGPLLTSRSGSGGTAEITIISMLRASWSRRWPAAAWSGWTRTVWWDLGSSIPNTGSSFGGRSPSWDWGPPFFIWETRRGDLEQIWLDLFSTKKTYQTQLTLLLKYYRTIATAL